ncbi:hypothetical protein BX616_003002 [Lobosporangium transversale]|uniref:Uncharacterized protein n=1 Tax=Lobosporangium transversale TaxID=64571 RepID=A0A1Y2GDU0_9FUNG|nr:hypothetical protein BCR41DRAFT_388748 [Lobosporangium transversale]KAF9899515.1 hypothetical protein BX616_003002 [Lobosporangium transversale]ORZ08024.1 hypothetical protein BCR41DRAFT_388748 [Lobosporangium transversale]|eukprot:XP_021878258.1 hypothetical protein BCR41DRAFT_388748 [Lobosporangium transversale]
MAYPILPTNTMGSYFDLVKPISIPIATSFHREPEVTDGILHDQDADGDDATYLPEYLQSFHDSGVSDARLKRFNWLHPKNYSGEGSLSDDLMLSSYGTSVSSPRGDAWEIVDHGPGKSIDELWDEVFEYQQRIKLLEQIHRVQAAAAAQAQHPDSVQKAEQQQQQEEEKLRPRYPRRISVGESPWREYSTGSETCYSPSFMTISVVSMSTASVASSVDDRGSSALALVAFPKTMATIKETPMMISSGTVTQIDKTAVLASRKGIRSERGSALRLLHSALRTLTKHY